RMDRHGRRDGKEYCDELRCQSRVSGVNLRELGARSAKRQDRPRLRPQSTPQRALVIGFSRPVFMHGFGTVAKKGFEPKTWGDLNKPDIRIAVDIGSVHELAARNFASKGEIIGLKTRDECVLAVQTGRADCVILAVILGLTAVKKNPALGKYIVLR